MPITLCYSGKSKPSAALIAEQDPGFSLNRGRDGDINWGRSRAHTRLNPDTRNATNKRVMRELFKEHGVPMPKLWDTTDLRGVRWPLVGRPDKHTKGRGFWLCNSKEDVEKAKRGTRRKMAATHFMRFVQSDHEFRVHIFKGKSIRISEKKFFEDEGGKRDYTTIKPTSNIKHVRRAAKKAVKALGLDFGAVDVLATDDECWVLEVNTAPGLGGTMPKVWAETFTKWYERTR